MSLTSNRRNPSLLLGCLWTLFIVKNVITFNQKKKTLIFSAKNIIYKFHTQWKINMVDHIINYHSLWFRNMRAQCPMREYMYSCVRSLNSVWLRHSSCAKIRKIRINERKKSVATLREIKAFVARAHAISESQFRRSINCLNLTQTKHASSQSHIFVLDHIKPSFLSIWYSVSSIYRYRYKSLCAVSKCKAWRL